MTYSVILRRREETFWFTEALLDGLVPQSTVDLTTCEKADEMGLCRICESQGARCHVLVYVDGRSYKKHCPVLWNDLFHPRWKIDQLA